NVARHAAAQSAWITLRSDADAVLLEVKDDGCGITDDALRDPNSLGLLGIRERARLLGGTVDIRGLPRRGTTLRVRLPRLQPAPQWPASRDAVAAPRERARGATLDPTGSPGT